MPAKIDWHLPIASQYPSKLFAKQFWTSTITAIFSNKYLISWTIGVLGGFEGVWGCFAEIDTLEDAVKVEVLELGLGIFDPGRLLGFGGGVRSSLAMNFLEGFGFLGLDFFFLEA